MYVSWRREEVLADVQLNEYLHFASESGMIEYLNLRTYHSVEPAGALALTRQILPPLSQMLGDSLRDQNNLSRPGEFFPNPRG